MKNIKNYSLIILFFGILSSYASNAQIMAVTEYGDTIFVYNNGTWSFSEEDEVDNVINELDFLNTVLNIDTLTTPFVVDKSSTKEAKSKYDSYKILFNNKIWERVPPGQLGNDEAEMAFISKEKDLYALVVAEQVEIGKENILKIALKMMGERTGGKTEIIKVEQRIVNGQEVLRGVFDVDISGINMRFDSYYFSNAKGTVQFTTWTGINLWKSRQKEIEDFLNGLIILE